MLHGLRHIRGFLAVAQCGNFTRASIALGVSQPALTVQIQQLEESLGVTLLDRNTRTVTLTQAGEEMLGPLERILADVEAIMGGGRDHAELRRGTVTVAAVPSLAATLVAAALAQFCRAYPGISVRLRDSRNIIELVKSGEADLGVGGDPQRDPAVAVEELYAEPICVFVPKGHALATRRHVALADVAQYPVIMPQRHGSLRTILQRALDQRRIHLSRVHETSHLSTTLGLVNAGLGVGILPRRALECFPSAGLACVPIGDPPLERRVAIATRAGRTLAPAVQKLIEILRELALRPAHADEAATPARAHPRKNTRAPRAARRGTVRR
jgi:DNA-binding transcriptional LysR family regulator